MDEVVKGPRLMVGDSASIPSCNVEAQSIHVRKPEKGDISKDLRGETQQTDTAPASPVSGDFHEQRERLPAMEIPPNSLISPHTKLHCFRLIHCIWNHGHGDERMDLPPLSLSSALDTFPSRTGNEPSEDDWKSSGRIISGTKFGVATLAGSLQDLHGSLQSYGFHWHAKDKRQGRYRSISTSLLILVTSSVAVLSAILWNPFAFYTLVGQLEGHTSSLTRRFQDDDYDGGRRNVYPHTRQWRCVHGTLKPPYLAGHSTNTIGAVRFGAASYYALRKVDVKMVLAGSENAVARLEPSA
ncbi:hypothetical protein BKA70DRAFT_1219423 [Coprinopsis sp. MPI-PUGE-AT-0042]|nr:hypothetical protein BKA70DRAFT_1219423 [Coprinopsis sp. MPI-PUGE-AT-0042]